MQQYLNTMRNVLETGVVKGDRTGTGTISKFGGLMRFPLDNNQWHVPTTRKVAYMKIAEELEWMIKGLINVQWLNDKNNNIWNSWVGADGTIGPMYGEQWRNWNAGLRKMSEEDEMELTRLLNEESYSKMIDDPELTPSMALEVFKKFLAEKTKPYEQGGRGGVDQLQGVVTELLLRPESRRICVNVWNASVSPDPTKTPAENVDMGNMALAACHSMWQVNTQPMSDMDILFESSRNTKNADAYSKMVNKNLAMEMIVGDLGWAKIGRASVGYPAIISEITPLGQTVIDAWKQNGKPMHKLSLLCFARSQDLPLGTAYNVGMYSLLAHLLASLTNMIPHEYIHVMGDYHIYLNQVDLVKEQLQRQPMKTPRVLIDPTLMNINDFEAKNLIVEYESHPALVFPKAAV